MSNRINQSFLSVDEVLEEAYHHETKLMNFYYEAMRAVGSEARPTFQQFYREQQGRRKKLEKLLDEIHELQELTSSIAD